MNFQPLNLLMKEICLSSGRRLFPQCLLPVVAAGCLDGLMVQAQTSTPLKSFGFSSLSGVNPRSALIEGDDGALYGTTEYGGVQDLGTVFKVAKTGTNYSVLKSFSGGDGDGARPYAGLLKASNGFLYGTTGYGGSNEMGTVFRLTQDGNNYEVLKIFSTNTVDGRNPRAGLMQGSDGLIYGTTYSGGSSNAGTVFCLDTNGDNFAVIKSFTGRTNDGGKPFGTLVEGTNGALWGTTFIGGLSNRGTVFMLNKNGSGFYVPKSFKGVLGDGQFPQASLNLGSDKLLYGSTRSGGASNWGTIFRLGQNGSNYIVVGTFTDSVGGMHPHGSMVEGSDGAMYGTTYQGGTSNYGAVFKINKDGSGGLSIVTNFLGAYGGGINPEAGLLKASDGAFYGTTYRGGANKYGTLFKLTQDGTLFSDLRDFSLSGGDGSFPDGVFQASDGLLYGIAEGGGSFDMGAVFKMNVDGSNPVVLHHFNPTNADGCFPTMLRESTGGWLLGTTYSGGDSNLGTVFKLDKNGDNYQILRSFSGAGGDGANPYFLTAAADDRIYGTTFKGGTNNNGVIFGMNPDASGYSVLRIFRGYTTGDGANPGAGLLVATDGYLYGITEWGGTNSSNPGTIMAQALTSPVGVTRTPPAAILSSVQVAAL